MHRLRRFLLVATGSIAVALGTVGMFLPLLPTTPFLLLAAYCFARSSPTFHRWLLTNRVCGSYLDNYRSGRGMAARNKAITLLTLWVSVAVTIALVITSWWGRLLLAAVAAGVTVHLLRLPTFHAGRDGVSTAQPHETERAARECD